jgi:DNA-binding ferritin-like protein (Dps family)
MPEYETYWHCVRRQKREWRGHVRRVKALPPDYRAVLEQIEKYIWNFAADEQMIAVLDGILDLFEEGASQGRSVLEVTGDDVAAFVRSILEEVQSATWMGRKADQLNAKVRRILKPKEASDDE